MIGSMHGASAISVASSTAFAAADAVEQLQSQLPDGADLAMVFATPQHGLGLPVVSRILRDVLGCQVVMAATSCGVIGVGREMEIGPAMSVVAARLPNAGLSLFDLADLPKVPELTGSVKRPRWADHGMLRGTNTTSARDAEENQNGERGGGSGEGGGGGGVSPAIGPAQALDESTAMALKEAIASGTDRPDPKLLTIWADPFSTPIHALLASLAHAMPQTPLLGGCLASSKRPGRNRMLLNEHELTRGAIGLAVYGDVQAQVIQSCGARPVSSPVVVTKAKRMLLQGLGGHPAPHWLDEVYQQASEKDRQAIASGRLLVGRLRDERLDSASNEHYVMRCIAQVNRQRGGYVAVEDPLLRTGQTVRFFVMDPDSAKDQWQDAVKQSASNCGGANSVEKSQAAIGLMVSSWRRGSNLFGSLDQDAELVQSQLGPLPVGGLMTHGEMVINQGQWGLYRYSTALATLRPTQ